MRISDWSADVCSSDLTIEDFKSGKIRALVNNNVLTTGFDFPGIDFIIILRATGSVVLWVQMLGRGTRPVYGLDGKGLLPNGTRADLNTIEGRLQAIFASDKHDCLVMDFARKTASLDRKSVGEGKRGQERGNQG